MARGKHRLPTPVRLLAAAAAVLTVGGIVIATGTASAHDERSAAGSSGLSSTAAGGQDRGDGEGKGNRGKRDKGKKGDKDKKDKGNKVKGNEGRGNQDRGNQDQDAEQFPGRDQAGGPFRNDFINIANVSPNVEEPRLRRNASTGSFTSVCGTNEEGHRNSDNFMVAPGKVNGAQHVHDYVGNLSTNAFSTDESLNAADTTCAKEDKSTYFWPVLRDTRKQGDDALVDGGGLDGNFGEILQPTSVNLQFRGNPTSQVTAMPEGLALITGDAKAATNGDTNAKVAWTCAGFEDRVTTKYPLCPPGSQLTRILDFPSCWDGKNLDSADHRTHIVFPKRNGSCGKGFVAVPQLRMTLTYQQPRGRGFALDSFPEQKHDPITDHADFMNMMPEELMTTAVNCINSGQNC
ncbi:MAG: DUF1996 domain-containing protein [Actinomycetota bacterium]|nr:DUF1996 domain-containing protein [Actinomycetota bacterium]